MAPPIKSTKVGTRGSKQIVEENASTLSFYRNMVFGATGAYLTVMMVVFEFTSLTITLTLLSGITYIACYQFMAYIAKPEYSDTDQLLKSGVDLNMEGGIADRSDSDDIPCEYQTIPPYFFVWENSFSELHCESPSLTVPVQVACKRFDYLDCGMPGSFTDIELHMVVLAIGSDTCLLYAVDEIFVTSILPRR